MPNTIQPFEIATIRRLACFLIGLACASALAQEPAPDAAPTSVPASAPTENVEPIAPPAAPELPKPATVRVSLTTSAGTIILELEKERAPVTTANFLRYVDGKRYDGITFYRAYKAPYPTPLGLIQGGVRNEPKLLLPPIKHEPTTRTGLSHVDGAISMARAAPGSAAGDFFIIVGSGMIGLDADPKQSGDNLGFAVFGHVVEGMDSVLRILNAPTSTTTGEGVMRGQMIAAPIRIISARRLPKQ